MSFFVGAVAGAISILAVQRLREQQEEAAENSLTDRMEEQIGALEERLGMPSEKNAN